MFIAISADGEFFWNGYEFTDDYVPKTFETLTELKQSIKENFFDDCMTVDFFKVEPYCCDTIRQETIIVWDDEED